MCIDHDIVEKRGMHKPIIANLSYLIYKQFKTDFFFKKTPYESWLELSLI